ncbi:sialate O-acetylesterase [Aquiflexum sp.]|uniref:sialate O-acetylesterase n=1 Tax=Aquiflexum sp. TaxID=1872584 RepID=UPI003593F0C1
MKILNIVLIFILFPLSLAAQETLDLFIWAGQSNAQGYTGDATGYPEDGEGHDKDILLNYTVFGKESSNGNWISMQPQKGRYPAGHFGPEVSFARELKKAGYNPAIFKYTLGGTGLARDWKAPGKGGIYDSMVVNLRPSIQKLKEIGYSVNIRGFIWIQGETDAGDEKSANDYEHNLRTLLNHLRSEVLQTEGLKVILGVDEQHYFVLERPSVIEAQKKIAKDDKNISYTSMLYLPKADTTHLTPAGLVLHGQRIFQGFKLLEMQVSNLENKIK